jgi:XTP/dITP diphosphohydrolase
MKQKLVFITGNANKLREVRQILGDDFCVINVNVDLQEIQSTSVEEVINEKIKEAEKVFSRKDVVQHIRKQFEEQGEKLKNSSDFTVVCEDTGFHIDSLNTAEKAEKGEHMFPGALIKFVNQALGAEGIIKHCKGSQAMVTCYIGILKNGEIKKPISAVVEGSIAKKFIPGGFGFDPCFIPKGKKVPYSQLTAEEKNEISHRGQAFRKLKEYLK